MSARKAVTTPKLTPARRRALAIAAMFTDVATSNTTDETRPCWHRTETEITLRAGNGRKSALDAAVEVLWSNRPFPIEPAGVQLTFAEAAS